MSARPFSGDASLHVWEHDLPKRTANGGLGMCNSGSGKQTICHLGSIGCDVDHLLIARRALMTSVPYGPLPYVYAVLCIRGGDEYETSVQAVFSTREAADEQVATLAEQCRRDKGIDEYAIETWAIDDPDWRCPEWPT